MSRTTSAVACLLAMGLVTAPMAFAEGGAQAGKASTIQTQPSTTAPAMKSKPSTKHAMALKVDLNSATRDELMKLPGIDGTIADKIIDARPFKSRSDLKTKGLVSKAEYGKIASHVFAKPAAAPAK